MSIEFSIHIFNWKTIASLIVIGVLIAWAIFFVDYGPRGIAYFASISLGSVIFCLILWQVSSTHIKLEPTALVVGGGLYRVDIPMEQIDRSAVRRWTQEDIGYKPRWRTNGIGMPGFSLGWFTSKQSKIFAAISDRDNLVIIPTSAG